MTTPSEARKGRPLLKAMAIGAVLLVLTTGVIIAFFGPAIASVFARGLIEGAVNPTIAGDVRVSGVSLSWKGPQKIGRVEVLDDSGAAVATFEGSADAGLFALATGNLDLGEVSVVRTDGTPFDANTARRLSAAFASTVPPTGEPASVPEGLKAEITVSLGSAEIGGATLSDVGMTASIETGQTTTVALRAKGDKGQDALKVDIEAPTLIGADGVISLSGNGLTIEASGEAPTGLLTAMLGVTADDADTLRLEDFSFVERDWMLVPKAGSRPTLRGRVTDRTIVALLASGTVAVDEGPSFTLRPTAFSVPLPGPKGVLDLRQAELAWRFDADPLIGSVLNAEGRRVPFSTERLVATARFDAELGAVVVEGTTNTSVDGQTGGVISIDALALGVLDAEGAIRGSGPGTLNASLRLTEVPGALIASADERLADAEGVIGERVDVVLEASISETQRSLNGATLRVGDPSLAMTLSGEHGSATGYFVYDGARGVRSLGERALVIKTENAGLLAQRFAGTGSPVVIGSDVAAELVMQDIAVMLDRDGALDTDALTGDAVFTLEALHVTPTDAPPVEVDSLRLVANIGAGTLDWSLDSTLRTGDRVATANGSGGVAGLFGAAPEPSGMLGFDGVPTSLATIVSAALGDLLVETVGDTVSGAIATTDALSGGFTVDLNGAFGGAKGLVRLEDNALVLSGAGRAGFSIRTERAGPTLRRLLADASGRRITLDDGATVSIDLRDASIALGVDRSLSPLKGLRADAEFNLSGVRGTIDGTPVAYALDGALVLTEAGDLVGGIGISGTHDGLAFEALGPLAIANLHDGSGLPDFTGTVLTSDITGTLPLALAKLAGDQRVRDVLEGLAGDGLADVSLVTDSQAARGQGGLTLTLASREKDTTLTTQFGPDRRGVVIGDTTIRATFTPELFGRVITPLLEGGAYEGVRLVSNARGTAFLPSVLVPLKNRMVPDFAMMPGITGRLNFEEDVVLAGVPSPLDGLPIELGARDVSLGYRYEASFGNRAPGVFLNALLFKPGTAHDTAAVSVSGAFDLPLTSRMGALNLSGDTERLDELLASDAYFQQLLGETYSLVYKGRAIIDQRTEESPTELTFESRRLRAQVGLWPTAEGGFEMRKAAYLGWFLTPESATQMLLGDLQRASGLRVSQTVRIDIVFEDLAVGPMETLFARDLFRAVGAFTTTRIVVEDAEGNTDDLGFFEGSVTALPDGTIEFRVQGEREAMGPQAGGQPITEPTLGVSGLLHGFADPLGRPTFASTRPTALDVNGTLPTRLIDALGGTDGLITALVGPDANVNATIDGEGGSNLNASFVGANASGSMSGTLNESVVRIPAGAEISLSRISIEASRRVLGTALPMFSEFQKTAQDQPALITTTGLAVPLDGDLAKLDGDLTVDLGTMRFATRSVLGQVLKLTNNRVQGQVGQKLDPFHIAIEAGVLRYDEVVLPLGEFNVVVGGSVNLKNRRVNTLVWVPFSALNDDLAHAAARVPGVNRLTMVPLRVRGPIDKPTVELDSKAMIQGLPDALLGTLFEDVPGGVGDLLNDIFNPNRDR